MSLHDAIEQETKVLRHEIEAFLIRTGMSASSFGREALNDPTFVFDLREGHVLRPKTIDRAREFMKAKAA